MHWPRLVVLTSLFTLLMFVTASAEHPSVSAAEISSVQEETGSQRPLPDVRALMRSVFENQKTLEATSRNYIFTKMDEEQRLESDGDVKKTETRKSEAFFIGGTLIERTIERDGKPLTPKEQAKESEKVEKDIKKAKEREAKRESHPEADEKASVTLSRLLEAIETTNPHREQFRGHRVIAFDFQPNPNFQPKKKEEELVHKMGGSLWVDEDAKQIVRVEARLLDTVKFAGFVGALHKGAAFTFEQQRVNDEIWLPSYSEAYASGRLLFKGIRVKTVSRFSDYRKFRVETAITPAAEVTAPAPQ